MKEAILATFALFFSLMVMAGQIFSAVYERKKRKDQEKDQEKRLEYLEKVNDVELMVINTKGYFAVCFDFVHAPQHVFCERMRSFCNAQCQFFNSAINTIEPKKPIFDCWMLPLKYRAKELHDWRNTKPDCAPEKKP